MCVPVIVKRCGTIPGVAAMSAVLVDHAPQSKEDDGNIVIIEVREVLRGTFCDLQPDGLREVVGIFAASPRVTGGKTADDVADVLGLDALPHEIDGGGTIAYTLN